MSSLQLPIKVLLDTSILLTSLKLPFDLFGEIERVLQTRVEFLIPKQVESELEKLSKRENSVGVRAVRALEMMSNFKVIDLGLAHETSADDALIMKAKVSKAIVATADTRLRRMLRKRGVPVLSLRGNRLICEPETTQYWPAML